MALMDNEPHDFVLNHSASDLKILDKFVHRTFNGNDCVYFICSLKNIYHNHGGLQSTFENGFQKENQVKSALSGFYQVFFEIGGERIGERASDVLLADHLAKGCRSILAG